MTPEKKTVPISTPSRLPVDLDDKRLIDAKQAAALLGFSVESLANMRSKGRGPVTFKIGRAVRYRVADLLAWAEAGRTVPGGDDEPDKAA